MKYSNKKLAQSIAQLLVYKSIHNVVLSPGSRNAPLTTTFQSHPDINLYSIVDERCAAFVALGMIQKMHNPVAICCTSGSALLNYYPAVSEAFYRNLPLIILSADRPKDKVDQSVGQTIRQENIFENHIGLSVNLTEDESVKGMQYNERLINEALNFAIQKHLPVHINIPFSEPLYGLEEAMRVSPKVIQPILFDKVLAVNELEAFAKLWNASEKKLVLVGMFPKDELLQTQINHLLEDPSCIVLSETTSNIHHKKLIDTIDQTIFSLNEDELETLRPEILLTIGQNIISKKVKDFIAKHPPKVHLNIEPNGNIIDTFDTLTHSFETSPTLFFSQFFYLTQNKISDYQEKWLNLKNKKRIRHAEYLAQCPFSDLKAMEFILDNLSQNTDLHLGNSSVVRYAQLFEPNSSVEYFSNRGTSGIDGSTSTAIGSAMMSDRPSVLITGDISFFYDSNALWNKYIPENFIIIIINNGGGEIFKFIPGPDKTDALNDYFVTQHQLSAIHLAQMYQFEYISIESLENLPKINLHNPKNKTIFEIKTQNSENTFILKQYFT